MHDENEIESVGPKRQIAARVYTKIFPPYALLIESYTTAQEVVSKRERLDLMRA